jgi:hypothetical protein
MYKNSPRFKPWAMDQKTRNNRFNGLGISCGKSFRPRWSSQLVLAPR